jgi:hypothetical protein
LRRNTKEAKEVWFKEGREEGRTEIAGNLLSAGSPCEFVSKITGLDLETVTELKI